MAQLIFVVCHCMGSNNCAYLQRWILTAVVIVPGIGQDHVQFTPICNEGLLLSLPANVPDMCQDLNIGAMLQSNVPDMCQTLNIGTVE